MSAPFALTRSGGATHSVRHDEPGWTTCGRAVAPDARSDQPTALCRVCFPPEQATSHPYRYPNGELDVRAYCQWLDDRHNAGCATGPSALDRGVA